MHNQQKCRFNYAHADDLLKDGKLLPIKSRLYRIFTHYEGRYPCYANKVYTIAKKDTVKLFCNTFHIHK